MATATKNETTTKNEAVAVEETEFDMKEITQAFRVLKFKLSTLQADARRRLPYMSATKEEAERKYAEAFKSVRDMTTQLARELG
ncbi:hypothetical protein [Microbacterium sp. CIAB417]|uniref:hypothetical protein n=1 Tax=Microbacterium sp. CIAB417 TaxID=2860287 RepID=UPI001FAB75CA|nr:hypothetical protein [Microbacterium sp. CIAB417]